tara:strand:- start:170 stop:328 length:159 start_codon:yes stop_codon:yes gene_type:complete
MFMIYTQRHAVSGDLEIRIDTENTDHYGDRVEESDTITKEMLLEVLGQNDKD